MKRRLFYLFESLAYYLMYLFSGLFGWFASLGVASVVIAVEYAANHMVIDNAPFFEQVLGFIRDQAAMTVILTNLIAVLLYGLAFRKREERLSAYAGIRSTGFLQIIGSVIAGVCANGLILIAMQKIHIPGPWMQAYQNQIGGLISGNLLIAGLAIVLIAPMVEELVFRGILFTSLSKALNPVLSAVVTALLFAIAHGNLVQGSYAFVLGLLLALVRHQSGSLWSAIALHFAFNTTSLLLAGRELEVFSIPGAWTVCAFILSLLLACRRNSTKTAIH